jgi:hypothetical protein
MIEQAFSGIMMSNTWAHSPQKNRLSISPSSLRGGGIWSFLFDGLQVSPAPVLPGVIGTWDIVPA